MLRGSYSVIPYVGSIISLVISFFSIWFSKLNWALLVSSPVIKILTNTDSHGYKIYRNILNLIDIRKKQIAFHPNATQYTLNLGNNFFGIWRQSIDRKQSIFAIYNVTNKCQKLKINKYHLIGHDFGAYISSYLCLLYPKNILSLTLMSMPFAGPPELKNFSNFFNINQKLALLNVTYQIL